MNDAEQRPRSFSIITVEIKDVPRPSRDVAPSVSWRKRLFDVVVTLLTSILWIPAVCLSALFILLLEGRPAFYISRRRVFGTRCIRLVKLRTMVKNAAQIVNRSTVPITDTRFLNISPESNLYTRIGRWIELVHFTELPQFIHVLSGKMCIVGNRPLPEDVARALEDAYPFAEHRFDVPCGMTGPVQLIGKENIRDEDRLRIEIAYTHICRRAYTMRLDFVVVVTTVFVALGLTRPRTVAEVLELMQRSSSLPTNELMPEIVATTAVVKTKECEPVRVSI